MDTPRSLAGKIAIITGASRGIGKAIAVMMAQRGARGITITYQSNADAARATCAELEAHGAKTLALPTPSTIENAFTDKLVQETLHAFRTNAIDILVNNAADMSLHPLGTVTPTAFNQTLHTNLLLPYLLSQSTLPHIRPGGSILNISSRAARSHHGGPTTLYCASKAALEHFTRNLAAEVAAEKKITVNAVMPGGTATDGLKDAPRELIERVVADATAEKRLGRPEEVADVVCFLAGGGGARWINGDTIAVCGGAWMS